MRVDDARTLPRLLPAALLALAAMLAAATVLAAGSGGEEEPAPARTVPELQRFVEQVRGLRFRHPVKVKVVPSIDPQGLVSARERILRKKQGEALQALGLLPPGTDLDDAVDDETAHGATGVYDPDSNTLHARGSEMTPGVRFALAHELTHALDDQQFGLERLAHDRNNDRGFALRVLVEGNAQRVEQAYLGTLTPADRQAIERGDRSNAGPPRDVRVPPFLAIYNGAPYELGPGFVQALLRHGGTAALDRAFRHPPQSSEQVLFPERYLSGDRPIPVPAPRPDGRAFHRNVFGAELLRYTLLNLDPQLARRAVEGWGGGRYVAWRAEGRPCVRTTLVGDTPRDTREIADAIRAWARTRPGSSVTLRHGRVTFTACAERPRAGYQP